MEDSHFLISKLKVMKKVCPKEGLDYEKVGEDDTLKGDIGLDSIQIIVIALAIEMEFGIEFSNYDVNTFKTVGNVVSYIEEALK